MVTNVYFLNPLVLILFLMLIRQLQIMKRNKKRNAQNLQKQSLEIQLNEINSPTQQDIEQNYTSFKIKNKQNKLKQTCWPIYRRFFNYSLKRWKFLTMCVLITIFSGFIASIFPWKVGILLDIVTQQNEDNNLHETSKINLIFNMIQLTFITLLIAVLSFLRSMTLKIYQQKLGMDLRQQIYSIFIKNDLYFFQMYKTGQLISRLGNDINQAKSAISNNLTFLLKNLANFVGTTVILFFMSWKLSLIVLTIVPVYFFITQKYTKKAKLLVRGKQDLQAQASTQIGQKFGGIQTIKAYCTEQAQIKKYVKVNTQLYQIAKYQSIYQGIHSAFSTFLPDMGALLVLLYAGIVLNTNSPQLSAGSLTSFIMYCNSLANTTSGISNSYTNIIDGTIAIQKVLQMMNYQSLVNEDCGKEVDIDGNIQFDKVNFKYPLAKTPIFKNLSFKIKTGQYVAFVGQSGSGKSTIAKLIQKFYQIHSGNIYFGCKSSKQINIKNLRQQIGFVNQEAAIFSGTIQQNIAYGLQNYSQDEMKYAAEKAGLIEFIHNKNLFPNQYKTIVGQRGTNLSGGQRQRIAIARAIMRKPKILIFDEATSALDSNSEYLVQQSIEELAKNSGITIIVIAHRLSTVIKCDRLYVMKEGSIIQVGKHLDLIKQKGFYYTLMQKQLQVENSNKRAFDNSFLDNRNIFIN